MLTQKELRLSHSFLFFYTEQNVCHFAQNKKFAVSFLCKCFRTMQQVVSERYVIPRPHLGFVVPSRTTSAAHFHASYKFFLMGNVLLPILSKNRGLERKQITYLAQSNLANKNYRRRNKT